MNTFDPMVTLNKGETLALRDLFTAGGDLNAYVASLRWTIRAHQDAGVHGIATNAENDLRNVQSAIAKIIRA